MEQQKTEPLRIMDGKTERIIDTLTDENRFRELLHTTSDICLRREFTPTQRQIELTPEERVVAQLGANGLRVALDMDKEQPFWQADDFVRNDDNNETSSERISPDTPLRIPEAFGEAPNLQLAHEVQEFGAALLAEAYLTLGGEVQQKIDAFKAAKNSSEQLAVLDWLDDRLERIYKKEPNGNTLHIYHPFRLSPKALGSYPNINLAPTCLSVNTIAASFFEQTETPHLCAGVMRTAYQTEIIALLETINNNIDYLANQRSLHLNAVEEETIDRARGIFNYADSCVYTPQPYHYANIIKLHNGWVLYDKNFGVREQLMPAEQTQIEQIYQNLHDHKNAAPGLELSFVTSRIEYPISRKSIFEALPYEPRVDTEELSRIFAEETESVPQKLYEASMLPLRDALLQVDFSIPGKNCPAAEKISEVPEASIPGAEDDQTFNEVYGQLLATDLDFIANSVLEDYFDDITGPALIEDYPYDLSRAKLFERARTDASFRQNRVEELQKLWTRVAVYVQYYASDEIAKSHQETTHTRMEVGLPAQKIGWTVLKEFDMHLDSNVSPSFWTSNWASHVPRTHAMIEYSDRPGQEDTASAWASASLPTETDLTYTKDTDTLLKFFGV